MWSPESNTYIQRYPTRGDDSVFSSEQDTPSIPYSVLTSLHAWERTHPLPKSLSVHQHDLFNRAHDRLKEKGIISFLHSLVHSVRIYGICSVQSIINIAIKYLLCTRHSTGPMGYNVGKIPECALNEFSLNKHLNI